MFFTPAYTVENQLKPQTNKKWPTFLSRYNTVKRRRPHYKLLPPVTARNTTTALVVNGFHLYIYILRGEPSRTRHNNMDTQNIPLWRNGKLLPKALGQLRGESWEVVYTDRCFWPSLRVKRVLSAKKLSSDETLKIRFHNSWSKRSSLYFRDLLLIY